MTPGTEVGLAPTLRSSPAAQGSARTCCQSWKPWWSGSPWSVWQEGWVQWSWGGDGCHEVRRGGMVRGAGDWPKACLIESGCKAVGIR